MGPDEMGKAKAYFCKGQQIDRTGLREFDRPDGPPCSRLRAVYLGEHLCLAHVPNTHISILTSDGKFGRSMVPGTGEARILGGVQLLHQFVTSIGSTSYVIHVDAIRVADSDHLFAIWADGH